MRSPSSATASDVVHRSPVNNNDDDDDARKVKYTMIIMGRDTFIRDQGLLGESEKRGAEEE